MLICSLGVPLACSFCDLIQNLPVQVVPRTAHQCSCVPFRHTLHLPSISAELWTRDRFLIGVKAHRTCSTVSSVYIFLQAVDCTKISACPFSLRLFLQFFSFMFSTTHWANFPTLTSLQVWILSFHGRWLPLSNTVQRPYQTAHSLPALLQNA